MGVAKRKMENSMDRRVWWTTVHGVATMTKQLTHTQEEDELSVNSQLLRG